MDKVRDEALSYLKEAREIIENDAPNQISAYRLALRLSKRDMEREMELALKYMEGEMKRNAETPHKEDTEIPQKENTYETYQEDTETYQKENTYERIRRIPRLLRSRCRLWNRGRTQ